MTLEEFLPTLPENPVIIDCGANEGQWVSRVKPYLKGRPAIFSIEMLKRESECCHANHPDISVLNYAVGSAPGCKIARVHGFSQSSSILTMTEVHDKVWGSSTHEPVSFEAVQVRTLDYLFPETRIDLLKLDLQGYELEPLKGSQDLLLRTSHVVSEVAWMELYEGQPLFADIDRFLQDRGFKFVGEFDVRMYWNDKAAGDGIWSR